MNKLTLSALSMAVAMTFSTHASANKVGVVTVDGVEQEVKVTEDFTIGSDNSKVVISKGTENYLMYSWKKADRTINGKDIQFIGPEIEGLTIEGSGTLTIGSDSTEKILFNVGKTALKTKDGNSVLTSKDLIVENAKQAFEASAGQIEINTKNSLSLNTSEIGIYAHGEDAKATINTHQLDVTVNSTKTYGALAGLYAYDEFASVDVTANDTDISVSGRETHGIYAQKTGQISVNSTSLDITSKGEGSAGVFVGNTEDKLNDEALVAINYGTQSPNANTINITSDYSALVVNNGGTLNMGNDKSQIHIMASGEQGGAFGLALFQDGSSANIVADTLVIDAINDTDARGIHVSSNTIDGTTARLDINANRLIINAVSEKSDSTGIVAMSEGEIHINADTTISAKDAILVRGDSIVSINEGKTNRYTQINGNIKYDFDKPTSDTPVDSTVHINLTGANSYWTGNTVVAWNGDPTPEDVILNVEGMKLSISDGASWTPTVTPQDSTTNQTGSKYVALNNLSLDGGIINITGKDIDVTIEKMQGQGTVNLATDLENGTSTGQLSIETTEGKTALDVNLMNKDMSEELTSDDLDAKTAQALLGNVGGENVKTSTVVKEGLTQDGFTTDSEGNTASTGPNTLMQSTLELASSAPLALNRIMMNDVRKRLGDIRTTNGTHGAWARYDGGKLSGDGGLENDFHTILVGIDTVPTEDSARMGVAFSYTDSDAEYTRGSADMKAYSLAMYATKMFDNGMFVDVIGRMGTADTDLVVDGKYNGSMNNVALSLSGEMGWRFDLSDMAYIEPQAEVTYTYVNDDKLTLSSAHYDINAVNSLMGRIGFAAGLKCPDNFGNVYVRASAVHEFLGDSKIIGVNGDKLNTYEIDGKDTWVEYGIGANFNVMKSTYVWADVERTTGGALDEDLRATVGVRYAW